MLGVTFAMCFSVAGVVILSESGAFFLRVGVCAAPDAVEGPLFDFAMTVRRVQLMTCAA